MFGWMDRKPLKPTWLTLVFYAAFAASVVQDAYTSPEFYRWVVSAAFQMVLVLLILAAFLVVVLGALLRSLRVGRFPWGHAAAVIGALVGAELIWRYGVNSLPGMGFKDVAIAVDMAKPAILLLGLAAILSERKVRLRPAGSASAPTTV
jgi:hypothetical protein